MALVAPESAPADDLAERLGQRQRRPRFLAERRDPKPGF
jgi:hypothetical protein